MALIVGLQQRAHWHQANALCNSGLGQLGQAFSGRVATDCNVVGLWTAVSYVLIVGGVVLAGAGIYRLRK